MHVLYCVFKVNHHKFQFQKSIVIFFMTNNILKSSRFKYNADEKLGCVELKIKVCQYICINDSLLNFLLFSRQNQKESNIRNTKIMQTSISYMYVSVSNLFRMDKNKLKQKIFQNSKYSFKKLNKIWRISNEL